MYLKKIYIEGSVAAGAPRVDYIKVLRSNPRWHVSPTLVERSMAEGWLSVDEGKMVLKTGKGESDLVYMIERPPGLFCCECDHALDDQHRARRHVLTEHLGADPRILPRDNSELQKVFGELLKSGHFESSDKENPAGYRRDNFYACVKQGS